MTSKAPAAVKAAILNVDPPPGFRLKTPLVSERSCIYDWCVRIEFEDGGKTHVAWICLADEACRSTPENMIILSAGRTSKATKHLRNVHNVISDKTTVENTTKRKREEIVEQLMSSTLYVTNPGRLHLLVYTLYLVNNNLPLSTGEYEETSILQALVMKETMRTSLSAARVVDSIIELYCSTKTEVMNVLRESRTENPSLTMMCDFWTCKRTHQKYLGVRVYMIDSDWCYTSFLLGNRRFDPSYGERDEGIQRPFYAWLMQLLNDFGLNADHFYGASSDAGSDVKSMLTNRLALKLEWCMAHMPHAATKRACGITGPQDASANTVTAVLVSKIKKTINDVKTIEKTGNLFAVLCQADSSSKSVKLVNFDAARFLSITTSIRRILDKWEPLKAWYDERAEKARRDGDAFSPFPLANHKDDLIHILSLLAPVAAIKRSCQAERPNQVDVLHALYILRMKVLSNDMPLKHYLSTKEQRIWINQSELTPLASNTKILLRDALDQRFFQRYYDHDAMEKASFVYEMQLRLHPILKKPEGNVNRLIRLCTQNHFARNNIEMSSKDVMDIARVNIDEVNKKMREKL